MELKIEGDPGTGNTYMEINIGHVEHYNTQPVTINNYYGTRGKAPASETGEDRNALRQEIRRYTARTLPYVLPGWKDSYAGLWDDILTLPEVEAVIYDRGRQEQTTFNRKEVCHIICYLGRHVLGGDGIFESYNATRIARSLGDNMEKSTRPELGFSPSKAIRDAIDRLLKEKYHTLPIV